MSEAGAIELVNRFCGDTSMEFGWINVFGAVIVILMMIPNIIYAIRNKDEKNKCTNWFMNVIEQVGRYACIILMWMSLLVWKFGFSSVFEMILYLTGNGCLLAAYWIIEIARKTPADLSRPRDKAPASFTGFFLFSYYIFRSFHICVCVPLSSASLYIP